MSGRDVQIPLNGEELTYHVIGDTVWGPEHVLLDDDDNLVESMEDEGTGYRVDKLWDDDTYGELTKGIESFLIAEIEEETGCRPGPGQSMAQYHLWCGDTQARHMKVVERIQGGFDVSRFPIPLAKLIDRLSEIVRVPLTVHNPFVDRSVFCIRVVRPHQTDNNPLHRDVWLDRLRNAVNIYVPVCGSDERSSLPMVPGSHRWKESEIERTAKGASINGIVFTVPAVTGAKYPLAPVRPNPGPNEVLLFSPYLIHGGAANLNADRTRVSLEMRFFREPNLA